MKLSFIFLILFVSSLSFAQNEVKKITAKSFLKKNTTSLNVDYLFWQETIDITGSGVTTKGRFQFKGLRAGLSLNRPWTVRWVPRYSAELMFGTTKGSGTEASVLADEFKNQMWFGLNLSAGLTYRTTAASELALFLPVVYRKINWSLEDGTAFTIDRGSSFSVGLGGSFIQRFTPRFAINASLVHQHMWQATVWSLGSSYTF